jgi:DNA processing protein
MEQRVGISIEELSALLLLDSVPGLGPQKFKAAFTSGISPRDLIDHPKELNISGKRGATLQERIRTAAEDMELHATRAKRYISAADKHEATIITYRHPAYPATVMNSNYPVPLLYLRGDPSVLGNTKSVACVGSRGIRNPYSDRQREFAQCAVNLDFAVVSGFALGADSIAHRAAFETSGKTICVMAGGLDRPFPPENRDFWEELLRHPGAVFVSEAPFGARASSLTLRKRNKLIVSFALGVLIGQSSETGGAMNAYRFSVEQHKPVATFESDQTDDTTGNVKIGFESKVTATTFKANQADHIAWEQWLRGLSFSI